MDAALSIVACFALKGAAYSGWCALGVRRFRPESACLWLAIGLGSLRLLLGLCFDVGVYLGSMFVVIGLEASCESYCFVRSAISKSWARNRHCPCFPSQTK